jgi:hypothetical protein
MLARTLALALLPSLAFAAPSPRPDASAEARALVDAWAQAQNRGDFAAYQALYAQRFGGIRRSGARTVRLDRKGWMRDRERMFKKKMEVAVEDLEIRAQRRSARVKLTQRFAQGTYKDVGPKALLLVRENGGLRIAREEMLASQLLSKPPPAVRPEGGEFAFVEDGEVVLSTSQSTCSGKKSLGGGSGWNTEVRCDVSAKDLPAELAAWKRKRVVLYDANGPACEATVRGFELVGRAQVHPQIVHEWDELSEDERADAALDQTRPLLVATLDGGCQAKWARLKSLPAPALGSVEKPDDTLSALARRAFRALPAHRALQSSYDGDGPWDEKAEYSDVSVIRGGATTLISIGASQPGCGDFNGSLWALFEVGGTAKKPKLKLLATDGDMRAPEAAFDSDGDGALEILFDSGDVGSHYRVRGGADGTTIDQLTVMVFNDCPC